MLILFLLILFIYIHERRLSLSKKKYYQTLLLLLLLYNIVYSYYRLDTILKSIIKRQIPFLIGSTITGIIMTYYYGFLFTIIVNSIIWYVISSLVSKYYYKSKGINDQKYLIQYGLSKIKSSRNKRMKTTLLFIVFKRFMKTTFLENSLLLVFLKYHEYIVLH